MKPYFTAHGTPAELDVKVLELLHLGFQPKGHQKLWNGELAQTLILGKKVVVLKYQTIYAETPFELDNLVNSALEEGWQIHSNTKVLCDNIICQSMVKKKKDKNKNKNKNKKKKKNK